MKKLSIILLLLATGCAHELTAPLSDVPVTSMASYFWAGTAINFKDDSTGAITDQITFRDSSNFLMADDADANNKLRTTIACTISPDTVFAENFVLGSVLDLDNGSYFTPLDTLTLVPHVLSAAVITDGDTAAFVATDSGVWRVPISSGIQGSFRYDGIDSVADIDALALSPSGAIYAATRSGHIWSRNPANGSWSQPSVLPVGLPKGAITKLACDANSIYAVVDGMPGVYQSTSSGYSWQVFGSFMSTKTISAVRADVYLNNSSQYLTLGSTDGTVGGYPTSGSGPQFLHSLGTSGNDTVYDLASNGSKILGAATANGIYQSDQSVNFSATPSLGNPNSTSLVFDNSPGNLFFIASNTVYSASSNSGSTWSAAPILPKFYDGTPLKVLNQSASSYLLTNSSFYQHNASTGWNAVPGFPRSYYPNLQGGLLLLKSNPTVDSSWRAGTLVTINHQSYPITARLLSRLDSLVIGGKSYSDVLVVRYAQEFAPGVVEPQQVPYWVIYYQRGRGPIMFDRVNGSGAPERRVVAN